MTDTPLSLLRELVNASTPTNRLNIGLELFDRIDRCLAEHADDELPVADEANRDQFALEEARALPTEQLAQFAELVWELASDRYQQPYPFVVMNEEAVMLTMVAGYRTGDYVRALREVNG